MSTPSDQRTLALRMSEGRIPVPEALHYAMSLADALRKLHDAGKSHGAVSPSSIIVTGSSLDLLPSLGPPATVTSYTAPEVLQGRPADARSDIFSFGAVVFEMLTGRRAFDATGQTELTLALCNTAPPPSGSPAVDRLVSSCMAKMPEARWQRMQKIIMELKLLSVAARRADAAAAPRGVSDTALRSEIQQLEGRLAARLAEYEKNLAAMQQTAGEAVESLRQQLAAVNAHVAAILERPVPAPVDVDALTAQIHGRVEQTIAAVTQQLQTHVQETAAAANRQNASQMQDALASASQELAAGVKERVDAARQQHEAHLQETLARAGQLHAQIQDAVAAANRQHTAEIQDQMQERLGSASQELATRVKETVDAVSQQHAALQAQIQDTVAAANQQHAAAMMERLASANQELAARVMETVDAANRQHAAALQGQLQETVAHTQQQVGASNEAVAAVNQRVAAAEQNMEEIRKHFTTLQANVAGDLHDFEITVKAQGAAIDSARTAMGQTDDLVERVVEALELLQSSLLDLHETAGVN